MYQVDGFVGPSTAFLPLACFSLKVGCLLQLNDEVLIFYLSLHAFFSSLSFNKALKKQIPPVQGWLYTSTRLAKLRAPSVGMDVIL